MPRQPFPGYITAIEPQAKTRKHLGQRLNVFVNERFSFAIDASLVARHDLHPGMELDAVALSALLQADGDARAYARALHFLSYRTRSTAEVRSRLERDAWPEEVIARVIERLATEQLLNDTTFAAAWVEHRSLSRPRGARALRQELRHKGVGREEVDAALPDSEQEVENAVVAMQSKLRLWAGLEERERNQKIIQFLQRRGFNYGTAKAALAQIEQDEE